MLKTIPPSNISVNPLRVHKEYRFTENTITPYFAKQITGSLFDPLTDEKTNGVYKRVLYDSIKSQFYTNPATSSILTEVGFRNSYASTDERSIGSEIGVISIPQSNFGEGIKRGSVSLELGDYRDNIIIDGTNDGFPDGTNDTCIPPPHMQQASDIDLPLGSLGFIEKQYIAWISEGTPSKSAQLEPASEIQFGSLIHSDGATLGTFDGLSLILGMYDGTVEGDKLGSVDGIELGVVDGLLEVDGATECSKLGNAEVVGLLEGIEDGIFDVKAEPPHIQQA